MYFTINKLKYYFALFKTQFLMKTFWGEIGKKTVIYNPLRIMNSKNIYIGNNVVIEKNATLYSIEQYNGKCYQGKILIGNNVYINYGFNATAASKIVIGDDTLIAFNVSLFDFNHGYLDIRENINRTDLIKKGPIIVGEKSWIGMNVVILGNVTIGKHCVIGANSVVTKDVPDYSIVVGNPARIIKQYNVETKTWEMVER